MRNGANSSAARHTPNEQAEMLADARSSVCGYLFNLIGRRVTDVACALYPKMGLRKERDEAAEKDSQ